MVKQLKMTREEREKQKEEERTQQLNEKIRGLTGFRQIVELIRNKKIPVVAHNSLLDYCYFYSNDFFFLI